jgi:hypothetical protein
MPRKLENGTYEFKGGCIGEKDTTGKYTLVSTRKRKKRKNISKKVEKKIEKKIETKPGKKRRSQKKQFKTIPQKGGNKSNLNITVSMLRNFYTNNI